MKVSLLVLGLAISTVNGASRGETLRQEKRNLSSTSSMGSMGMSSSSGGSSGSSSGGYDPDCFALDGSEPDDCVVCTPCAKVRPPTLTLSYNPIGMNSLYQDETKASCRADTYPASPGVIDVLGKDGDFRESWPVTPGVPFTLTGTAGGNEEFDSETRFSIPGWTGGDGSDGDECFIHTSCSQPLVIGDQIGPFIIMEGNECIGTDAPVTAAPVTPAPVTPSPTTLAPVTPVPTTPAPVTPVPTTSAPITPVPTTPAPVTPVPTTSAPITPVPTTPAPVTPVPTTASPTIATEEPCIFVDTTVDYCNGAPITVEFNYEDSPMPAMIDDWMGIYPCETEIYKHAIVWQWACGALPSQCTEPAQSGTIRFDSEPSYNAAGPHFWPTGPGCFKVVILRNDGPSVPPYIPVCESLSLNVIDC